MSKARWMGVVLACVVLAAGFAADAGEKEESRVVLGWDQFKAITGWDGRAAPGEVVIPWNEVQKLLNVELKGMDAGTVKLPWAQFRKLVEWSVKQSEKKEEAPPPVDYVITRATYDGVLTKDVATFDVTLQVTVLRQEGWKRVRLLPASVGIDTVKLPDGAHLNVTGSNYELLTKAVGDLEVSLRFAASVSEAGGQYAVSLDRPAAGLCVLKLKVTDQEDVKLHVAGAQGIEADGETAFALPAGQRISIQWERKIEEVAKAPPKLYAQTQTLVAVGDGVLTCNERVTYSIIHAGVRELSLKVPDGANVLDVSCSHLHDWRVADGTLTVTLSREVMGTHELYLTYEKVAAEQGATLDAPVVTTVNTERERGWVAVVALANVEIAGAPGDGASAVDSSTLPPELVSRTSQPVLLAYRYVGKAFNVPLEVRKHKDVKVLVTVVDAATFTVMQTLDGRRITRAVYDVRNNRNQFLRVKMPAGSDVWSVSVAGKAAQPAKDDAGMTLVPLVRSTGQELTAFPVELVYVEEGFDPPATGKGTIEFELPTCSQPIMNVMVNLYLPKEGRYSGFGGDLTRVDTFRLQARVTRGREVEVRDAQQQAQQIQQQVQRRQEREAPPGVKPIQIQLPTSGHIFRFQKILVLEGDKLGISLRHTHWPGYEEPTSRFLGIF